jgi:chaperonin cofactor prefoldin
MNKMQIKEMVEHLKIRITVLEAENKGLREKVRFLELRLQAMQDDNEEKSFKCGMSPQPHADVKMKI